MAWVGTGAFWTLSSGALKGAPLEQAMRAPMMSHDALRFVQISDSHIDPDIEATATPDSVLRWRQAITAAVPGPERGRRGLQALRDTCLR